MYHLTCCLLLAYTVYAMEDIRGKLIGIYPLFNRSMAVMEINRITGDHSVLDVLNTQDGYFDQASSTNYNGLYYVSLVYGAKFYCQLFVIDVKTGQTVNSKIYNALPFYNLAFDHKRNKLFGISAILKGYQSVLYNIDINTLEEVEIGKFPYNWVPNDNGGTYDENAQVYYVRMTNMVSGSTNILGISTYNGSLVSNVRMDFRSVILFTLFYDGIGKQFLSIAQPNVRGSSFTLNSVDVNTGISTRIGSSTYASSSFYPTVSALSPLTREYFCLFNSQNQPGPDFVSINIDTGMQNSVVRNWVIEPVDIQYVQY